MNVQSIEIIVAILLITSLLFLVPSVKFWQFLIFCLVLVNVLTLLLGGMAAVIMGPPLVVTAILWYAWPELHFLPVLLTCTCVWIPLLLLRLGMDIWRDGQKSYSPGCCNNKMLEMTHMSEVDPFDADRW